MKPRIALMMVSILTSVYLFGQQADLHPIQIDGKKMFHLDEPVKSLSDLEQITAPLQSTEVNALIKSAKTIRNTSNIILGAGVILSAVGLVNQIKNEEFHTLQIVGPIISLGSIVYGAQARKKMFEAADIYNQEIAEGDFGYILEIGYTRWGAGLIIRF